MALVSVIQAAKLAKVSRKTIYKYLEDGKLSASKDRNGHAEIEVSELLRVFGNLPGLAVDQVSPGDSMGDAGGLQVTDEVTAGGREVTPGDTQEKAGKPSVSVGVLVENARLEAENSQLKERLAEALRDKAALADDKEKLFARLSEAQATVKLLTGPEPAEAPKKSLWARLVGR